MRLKQVFVVETGFEVQILFKAGAAVGHLLIPFCAGKANNRAKGRRVTVRLQDVARGGRFAD